MDGRLLDDTIANRFLRALAPQSLERLRPHLEHVPLSRRQVIYAPGQDASAVYFVEQGLVSLVKSMRDGRSVEVGMVGAEGAVGAAALLGLRGTLLESIVQLPGSAWRIKSAVLRDEAARDPELDAMVRRYAALQLAQIAQIAACNRLHGLQERCCRWLLTAHDNAGDETIQLTHETLALMLGVQRPGVSIAARSLQSAGLISYQNGRVSVLDRPGLEAASCECYGAMRRQHADLFGNT